MTTYVALFSLTDAGMKAAKDSPRRLDAAKKLLTERGQGEAVLHGDGRLRLRRNLWKPDDAVMARYVLQLPGALASCAPRCLEGIPGDRLPAEIIRSLG